jgi:ABC-type antimicrobial peptide transport system permease subunit
MIVAETIMLGAIGIFVGTLLGAGWNMGLAINGFDMSVLTGEDVDQLTFQGINFDFRIYPRLRPVAILQGLTAMGITSLLSCLWPASYVTRLQPTEAMR